MNQTIGEKRAASKNGMPVLIGNILLTLICLTLFVLIVILLSEPNAAGRALLIAALVIVSIYCFIAGPIVFCGVKTLKPNEALVLTLFGKYLGTLRGEGIFFVNPFVSAFNPTITNTGDIEVRTGKMGQSSLSISSLASKKVSLKSITLSNEKQKINDALGNPIIIGIVVIWRVVDTAKAVFNVDNYKEYLSIQCDSALRNIVRLYPYDSGDENEMENTLRGGSQEISEMLKTDIQEKVVVAGLEIQEARITHLSYAPEIAAVMLQRQQASAIIDARQMIVDGAVGMVELALNRLNEGGLVHLDEERKASMVNNLLVVLCGNKDAQPIVNSGSIY